MSQGPGPRPDLSLGEVNSLLHSGTASHLTRRGHQEHPSL